MLLCRRSSCLETSRTFEEKRFKTPQSKQPRCHKHSQLSSLSSQKILDPGRNFLISYTFHKSIPLEVLQDIAQGLGAYTWKFPSQMVEPQRSFVSKLSQGT